MSYWQSIVLDWAIIAAALAVSVGTLAWIGSQPKDCRDRQLSNIELRDHIRATVGGMTGSTNIMRGQP